MVPEIGRQLRAKREELGLALQEVSLALKINTRILKAIEDNETENLPPKTFLRGFIQSYASYLRMDAEKLLNLFYQEMGPTQVTVAEIIPEKVQAPEEAKTPNKNPLDFIQPKSKTASIFVGLFVVIAVMTTIGILRMIEKYQSESQQVPIEPVQSIPENNAAATSDPSKAANTTPTVAASNTSEEIDNDSDDTDPVDSSTAKSTPAAVSTPAPVSAPSAPPIATKTLTPPPVAKPTPPPAPPAAAKVETPKQPAPPPPPVVASTAPVVPTAPPATTTPPATPPPTTVATTPAEGPQEVIIEAIDTVTIDYEIDDQPSQKIQMKAEELRTLKAKGKLKIKVSDGGAVNIVHNGRDRGVPGKLGKSTTLQFPRKTQ